MLSSGISIGSIGRGVGWGFRLFEFWAVKPFLTIGEG